MAINPQTVINLPPKAYPSTPLCPSIMDHDVGGGWEREALNRYCRDDQLIIAWLYSRVALPVRFLAS